MTRPTQNLARALTPVRELLATPWFTVYDRGGYLTVETDAPQVIVLPLVEEDSLVMVRVKRPVLGDAPLELPAGGAKPGESPVEAAARELFEETGMDVPVERFRELPPISHDPNRCPALIHVFEVRLAREEFEHRGTHDEEISQVMLLGLDEAVRMVTSGAIYVSAPAAIIARRLLLSGTPVTYAPLHPSKG